MRKVLMILALLTMDCDDRPRSSVIGSPGVPNNGSTDVGPDTDVGHGVDVGLVLDASAVQDVGAATEDGSLAEECPETIAMDYNLQPLRDRIRVLEQQAASLQAQVSPIEELPVACEALRDSYEALRAQVDLMQEQVNAAFRASLPGETAVYDGLLWVSYECRRGQTETVLASPRPGFVAVTRIEHVDNVTPSFWRTTSAGMPNVLDCTVQPPGTYQYDHVRVMVAYPR